MHAAHEQLLNAVWLFTNVEQIQHTCVMRLRAVSALPCAAAAVAGLALCARGRCAFVVGRRRRCLGRQRRSSSSHVHAHAQCPQQGDAGGVQALRETCPRVAWRPELLVKACGRCAWDWNMQLHA